MNLDDVARFDATAYAVARERMVSAPLALTHADFEMLAIVSSVLERQARDAHRRAVLAQLPPAAAPASPRETKSAPAAAPARVRGFVTRASLDRVFDGYSDAVIAIMKAALTERDTRIDALEAKATALEARVQALQTEPRSLPVAADQTMLGTRVQ